MCKKIVNQIMGAPSGKSVARQDALAAARAEAMRPARAADEGRDDTGAVVLEDADTAVETGATDVSMVTAKKTKRKGVPGLGL